MPAEGRENHLLKKGNSDAFFREKYLTKNTKLVFKHHLTIRAEKEYFCASVFSISCCLINQVNPVLICRLTIMPDPLDRVSQCAKFSKADFSIESCDIPCIILNLYAAFCPCNLHLTAPSLIIRLLITYPNAIICSLKTSIIIGSCYYIRRFIICTAVVIINRVTYFIVIYSDHSINIIFLRL